MIPSAERIATMVALGAVLVAIAWRDARRFEVDWAEVLALGALGFWWQGAEAWLNVVWGIALGSGTGLAFIAVARARGRKRPLFGGDVMLLGACGAVLGPMGLAVSWLLNVPVGIAYRWWLGRRRGRAWRAGYVPMGPAYCAAVGAVLWWQGLAQAKGGSGAL